jgi:hypothetical protein
VWTLDCAPIFWFSPDKLVRPMPAPPISMQIIMPNAIANRADTLILSARLSRTAPFVLFNMNRS